MSPTLLLATNSKYRPRMLALLGVVVVGAALVIGTLIWMARQEALREAGITSRNYVAIIEARLDGTLRRVDAILQTMADTLPKEALSPQAMPGYTTRIHAALNSNLINFEEVVALRVVDANGQLLYSSDEIIATPANIADRGYFRQLRDTPEKALVFSEVLISRVTGKQALVAARSLRDAQGRFLGVVVAGLDLEHFQRLFQSMDIGPLGLIAIRRSDDFSLVVRWPPADREINKVLPIGSPTRSAVSAGTRKSTAEFVGVVDGILRTFSFQQMARYPFYVLAALAHDDILAGWKSRAAAVGTSAILLLALLVYLLLRLERMTARERHLLNEQMESETTFEHLFENMNDPILLLKNGRFIDCNAATLTMLRYGSKEEFINRPPAEISPARQPDGRSSDEKAEEMIATAIEKGYHRFEWMHSRADGSDIPVEVTLTPITMGGEVTLHTLWRDISERQTAEHRLRLLASVFEHSGEAIVITDRDNCIVEVNQAFTRLTGYSTEEVLGQNPRMLASGRTTAQEFKAMWRAIEEESFWQGEVWDKRKDGSFYPKWLAISAVRNNAREIDYYVGSFTDISERKAAQERINQLAMHDTLTGLPNRYNLQGRLEQALATARRDGGQLALMFIDLDRFKDINDTLGHHVGDDLLQEVAARLTASVRDSDVVARLGGDEFVVVLTDIDATVAGSVADKILKSLGVAYSIEGYELHSTPSIGIAIFPDDGRDAETLTRNADIAMYHAKSAGRNNIQFFTAAMNQAAKDRHELEVGLHRALERNQLELHYQPQIDGEGRVIGAEALLRWPSPEHGMVSPLSFIPMAEETGLILPIGQWVLATACAQLKTWSTDERLRELRLAVNVSPREFREPGFVDQLHSALDSSGANPARLKLELTESLVLDNIEETIRKMQAIKKLGITFSLDDFGTGYSSLSYLTRLPLDQLKIDRAFVLKLPESTSDGVVTQTIITMAKGLGLNAIAEGVETDAQLNFLETHGCHAYQGYLFSPPLPLSEFEDFVRSR
ncbi:MAG: EAL domain-containing protein [Sulfuritalea sp.]|nr:EAL domain-containing protein [Sulfuritalea sp.]